jgi:hypothetical protein
VEAVGESGELTGAPQVGGRIEGSSAEVAVACAAVVDNGSCSELRILLILHI